jgi:hypothetical protein
MENKINLTENKENKDYIYLELIRIQSGVTQIQAFWKCAGSFYKMAAVFLQVGWEKIFSQELLSGLMWSYKEVMSTV